MTPNRQFNEFLSKLFTVSLSVIKSGRVGGSFTDDSASDEGCNRLRRVALLRRAIFNPSLAGTVYVEAAPWRPLAVVVSL